MVQDQILIQKRENEELLTRNQKLYDSYTRMDIECNRMSEDLLASNQLLEQLRNECANLRAEKKIWEVSYYPPCDVRALDSHEAPVEHSSSPCRGEQDSCC